jgi:putative addiction module killer protein
MTYELIEIENFTEWRETLADNTVKGRILNDIQKLRLGLGDVERVGDKVFELRIHFGAGWRVYFVKYKNKIFFLLGGGSKRTQKKDIAQAKELGAQVLDQAEEILKIRKRKPQ